jgi:hypothetical protein
MTFFILLSRCGSALKSCASWSSLNSLSSHRCCNRRSHRRSRSLRFHIRTLFKHPLDIADYVTDGLKIGYSSSDMVMANSSQASLSFQQHQGSLRLSLRLYRVFINDVFIQAELSGKYFL